MQGDERQEWELGRWRKEAEASSRSESDRWRPIDTKAKILTI